MRLREQLIFDVSDLWSKPAIVERNETPHFAASVASSVNRTRFSGTVTGLDGWFWSASARAEHVW
jgi:hypothetical protein